MVTLKKADILRGINDPVQIEIKSLGGNLWLRPLSNKEIDELEEMEAKAMGTFETKERASRRGASEQNSTGKLNVAKITRASAEVQVEKVFRSLDNPRNIDDEAWTYEEVNRLKKHQVNEIADKVDELSGVNVSDKDIERFHENE